MLQPCSAGSQAGTAAEAPSGQLGGLLAGSRRKGVAPVATCPCARHGALVWWAPTPSVLAQRVSNGGNVFRCLPEEGHMDPLPPPALSPALARKPQGRGLSLPGQLPALSTGLEVSCRKDRHRGARSARHMATEPLGSQQGLGRSHRISLRISKCPVPSWGGQTRSQPWGRVASHIRLASARRPGHAPAGMHWVAWSLQSGSRRVRPGPDFRDACLWPAEGWGGTPA